MAIPIKLTAGGVLVQFGTGDVIPAAHLDLTGKAEKPTAGVVAAAGTTQSDATAITADINNLSSSTTNQGVRLPAATAGARVVVSNTTGGRNIYVYPASGETIDVYATDAPFTLAAYALVEVFCAVAGLWQSTIRAAQSTSYFTSTMPANKGGTGASSYAVGDVLYANTTTTLAKLVVGTNGQVLTLADGVPTWAAPSQTFTGDVTVSGSGAIRGSNGQGSVSTNVVVGTSAFASNTTGADSVAVGSEALFSNTSGYKNVAVGSKALYSNLTGYRNNAVGFQALTSNTTGYNNTANGVNALRYNTSGSSNVANGFEALLSNTVGTANVANSDGALRSNTTGIRNVANGLQSLYSNTSGSQNLANGIQALCSNTTGTGNSASGDLVLYDLATTTIAATAIANGTAYQIVTMGTTTAAQWIASGAVTGTVGETFTANSTAGVGTGTVATTANIAAQCNYNTAEGCGTGRGITTGSGNTILGANVTGLAAGLTNNIILANGTGAIKAQHDGTNWTFIGGVALDKTVTTAGTTGAQTINKVVGSVNFAAADASLVVTNSLVTTNSVIVATVGTVDATMKTAVAVAGSGSFTLTANAAATAETRVNFMVFN